MINKTAIKITVLVALLSTGLFILLNFVVINRSEKAFVAVLRTVPLETNQSTSSDIITLSYAGKFLDQPIIQKFKEEFQESLLLVSIIGVGSSFIIGFLTAQIIVLPLRNLRIGIHKLRKSNYKFELERTGTQEFDELIDEFNHLTKELEKVENLRKDLLSDTSHELKTPIMSLTGQLEGIKDGILEPTKDRISLLLKQVDRLGDLVEKLQEYSRLRSKTASLNKSEFEFNTLVNEIIAQYKEVFKSKKIDFVYDVQSGLVINADKTLIERVFINFIDNALKYSTSSKVELIADDKKIIFQDNGNGVNEEHLPYLFERFYRVEKSRNRETGGLGLGLAIVKEIIEAHGWEIKAENRKKGGLRFVVKL